MAFCNGTLRSSFDTPARFEPTKAERFRTLLTGGVPTEALFPREVDAWKRNCRACALTTGTRGRMRTGHVLIVDDDEAFRDVLRDVLEYERCCVYEAHHGAHALEILEVLRPDLIISDLRMPVMDGWELCDAIERSDELRSIPLAVLSAVAHENPVKRARMLEKPLRLPTLLGLLDTLDGSSARSGARLA